LEDEGTGLSDKNGLQQQFHDGFNITSGRNNYNYQGTITK